ncbi:MAG: O-antigen ligase family protein [Ardenticatenaceae bacterium]
MLRVRSSGGGSRVTAWEEALRRWMIFAFSLFLILSLGMQSQFWERGPFAWGSLHVLPGFGWAARLPVDLGPLSLLPALLALTWAVSRMVRRDRRRWEWGWWGITLPLAALTLFILGSVGGTFLNRIVLALFLLSLSWFTYLFVGNERPQLLIPLAIILLLQGSVGVGQFLLQSDLGLYALEPTLDPRQSGVSVVLAQDHRWLRAYGLTEHPNSLGVTLSVVILMLLPALRQVTGWRRVGLVGAIVVGFSALLVSFSRAAWLGFAVGVLTWFLVQRGERHGQRGRVDIRSLRSILAALLLVITVSFLIHYRALILSRFFELSTYVEAPSIAERSRDLEIAMRLFMKHPWRGVGALNYLDAARAIDPSARIVHNIPLMIMAELGVLGGLFFLFLSLSPLIQNVFRREEGARKGFAGEFGARPERTALAPWLTLFVINLLQPGFGPYSSVPGTLLFALVAASIAMPATGAEELKAHSIAHSTPGRECASDSILHR